MTNTVVGENFPDELDREEWFGASPEQKEKWRQEIVESGDYSHRHMGWFSHQFIATERLTRATNRLIALLEKATGV